MKLYAEATSFDEDALHDEFNRKRQNFTSQPSPPYSVGDLWTQGDTGDIMVCRVPKSSIDVFSEDDWEKASKYTDDSALTDWLNGDYADDLEAIQNQIDSKAETWYQSNDPSTGWTVDEKQKHVGDLWYNTTANTTWRYNGTTWIQQNVPNAVFDAIDGKAQIFTGLSTPVDSNEGDLWFKSANDPILTFTGNQWVEYNKYTDDTLASTKIKTFIQALTPTATATGDLWIDTDDNNKMYRWNGSSWVRITDTSALKAFQDGTYTAFVTATNNSLSSKITTYYQSAEPSTHNTGDLWIDTGDGNKLYRWNGSSWVSIRDTGIQSALGAASNAQVTADGKIVTFAQASQPTATDRGDLWIDTDDDNKLYRWDGTSWVSMRDGTIAEAATKATSYISEINNNGIFVHEESDDPADKDPATGTGVHISDAINIVKDGLSYIWAGIENAVAKVRIGLANASHILFSSSGTSIFDENGIERTVVDSDGMTVKDADGSHVAEFGQDINLYDSDSGDLLLSFDDELGYMVTKYGYAVGDAAFNNGPVFANDGFKVYDYDKHLGSLDAHGIKGFNIKTGKITNVSVPANSYKDYTISYSGGALIGYTPFENVPVVVACFESTSTSANFGRCTLSVHSITTTTAKVRIFNSDTSERSPNIYWIAMDM